ncbi:hypothetical protein FA95DRAFT_1549271 [Auriscalpium vulgare]|uniref:Uncharacterized protein n=1 Tax=Auriscalpium vulgare TaxID=40419 RepID=A0ACB8RAI3_9AGAM|nr:hypothetical protein FA95DRAFT_1549271 [Auriscalpium vulgare]
MSDEPEEYLSVLKASYDYAPQSEDEIEIKEDQILLLLEKTDEEWWKVKVKGDADSPSGLVPSAYVEKADHSSLVKAQYDYDAAAQGELSIKEDQTLLAYGSEDDGWLLVQSEGDGKIGYVPANYVEEAGAAAPAAAAPPSIVIPDSPPKTTRPVSTYVDPADRVAATASKAKADDIKTWAIAEIDKKGKKKKGTLGIGNGAVFFASESDKTPVQKWPTGEITSAKIDKGKHVLIEVGGASPTSLHYNAGAKDTAEAILTKLESSRGIAQGADEAGAEEPAQQQPVRALPPPLRDDRSLSSSPSKKGVHFSENSPAIIPPRSPSINGDSEEPAQEIEEPEPEGEGEEAHALYDFEAQGEDELNVTESEKLWILERDGDEWWKCRNSKGEEGVVPASYLEPTGRGHLPPPAPRSTAQAAAVAEEDDDDDAAEQEAEREREARAAEEREARKQTEMKRATAAAAEAERKRKEQQRLQKEKEKERRKAEQEREEQEQEEEQEREREREREERAAARAAAKAASKSSKSSGKSNRKPTEKRDPPSRDQTRMWHDRTGQFRVEAAFLGYEHGMIRLHKVNGVVIEVPSEKMSSEDMRYVDSLTDPTKPAGHSLADDDDVPLAVRQQSVAASKKAPPVDWFEFFLNAGCDIDDCTRYATSFERDKIEESLLPDITEGTMRSLGLREGDIIRVKKLIDQRFPKPKSASPSVDLLDGTAAEGKPSSPSPGPPNLFAAGPNGALKTARRGRPSASKSTPPSAVDLSAISTASETIQRVTTPQQIASPGSVSSPVQVPQRTGSALAAGSGFDDDAWTPRPSSTRPIAPTPPALEARAPSAPPVPPGSVAAVPVSSPVVPPTARAQSTGPPSLAKTTESDIFDQLARLSQLRVTAPAISPAPSGMAPSPSIAAPPPASYGAGLGMSRSPVPMGQHLQAQQTGMLPPPQQQQPSPGPRGPFAPVPGNQGLLQPLIPTNTGFNGFVPTRPGASPFNNPQPSFLSAQPTGFQGGQQQLVPQQTGFPGQQQQIMPQQTGFQPQQTGFQPQQLLPQQTGFQSGFQNSGLIQPQQTGFGGPNPLMAQPTGMNGGQFGNFGAPPPVPSLPPQFQNQNNFGQLQPNPTGFNPGFGQPPPSKDNTPAGIFAQMKAGTFANDTAPQPQNKYDALRTNPSPLTAQPTGWGYPGFPGGYQG